MLTITLSVLLLYQFSFLDMANAGEPGKTDNLPAPFSVIPQPGYVELLKEPGLEYGKLGNLVISGDFKRPVTGFIISQLSESFSKGKGTLTLKLDNSGIAPESREGYLMIIADGNVEITSSGEAGLFYGCQTLEQLLEDARDFNTPIPGCRITDFPSMEYRAVHFDVKHHLDHMNYYYECIDRLAGYKINAVIFEFEDKLRYRQQPLVGAPQSISIEEMAALTEYARDRHIEISPLVQGLGHATYILKHDQYAHLRELPDNPWAFCPMDEGTYEVLFDLYEDAIKATPGSRYLHIGGDEVGNIGICPRCKPYADKEGMLKLNLYWLNRVCDFAIEKGRIPIFWDDMPLNHVGVYESTWDNSVTREQALKAWSDGAVKLEKVVSEFPENCIYMRWNYSLARQPGNILALDWYRDHDLKVMIATAAQTGSILLPFDEREGDRIAAIRSFIQLAAEKEIGGMLCTSWDDSSPHMETYWRGWIASAEYSWTTAGRTLEEFDEAYLQREYGLCVKNYAELYAKLTKAISFWEKAFRAGNRPDRLIELPDLHTPGSWSKKYETRLKEALLIASEYQNNSKMLDVFYKSSKRNRYHWELLTAINNFQITAPHLLLALKECDTDDKTQREKGIEHVNTALVEFNNAWINLQDVYAKTRFVSYPENYVKDRYFHFASQREDLSFLTQTEELFHQMVNKWLDQIDNN